MEKKNRILFPIAAFFGGSGLLTTLYFGIVSIAQDFAHAVNFFIEDRWLILPLIIGFGIQSSLYIILKRQLFIPIDHTGSAGAMTGASGGTSTLAMIACCAHHVVDVLPILGLTAAATFLAKYQTHFMYGSLGIMVLGILVMLNILIRERKKYLGITKADNDFVLKISKRSVMVLGSIIGDSGISSWAECAQFVFSSELAERTAISA